MGGHIATIQCLMVGGIMNDLTGKKFGRWTVLERDYEIIKTLA